LKLVAGVGSDAALLQYAALRNRRNEAMVALFN
jgi:hypothetical protein